MKTRKLKMEDGEWNTRSVLECGGKRSATPLSDATCAVEKLRRRCALPEQSKTCRLALLFCFIILHSSFCLQALGQQYSIDWYKIAGGGGTSTGGVYAASGTLGQHDADGPMTGGSYSLTGGFWALISVVQTPGLPLLTITLNPQLSTVTVSWPNTGSYTLQQNSSLANALGWNAYAGTVNTANGTNSITVNNPAGNLFFRLAK